MTDRPRLPLPPLTPPLRLLDEARRLVDDNRRDYARARIADMKAEPFPDCADCGNPCDFDTTQCAACRDADARADWADLQRESEGCR